CQSVTSPIQNPSSHVAFDVAEEARITTEPPHHGPREEHPEHRPPPQRVPGVAVERLPLFASATRKHVSDDPAAVDQRQNPTPEQGEVSLELARAADAAFDLGTLMVPEPPRVSRQQQPAATVKLRPVRARLRAHEHQQLAVSQRSISGNPELEAGELRGIQVDREYALGAR